MYLVLELIGPDVNRDDWLRVGNFLKCQTHLNGFELRSEWSRCTAPIDAPVCVTRLQCYLPKFCVYSNTTRRKLLCLPCQLDQSES
jgi:hypothetical protein